MEIYCLIMRRDKSMPQIAKPLDRSPTVIRNHLNNQENYGKNHKSGRQRNHIIRLASNKVVSCEKLKPI